MGRHFKYASSTFFLGARYVGESERNERTRRYREIMVVQQSSKHLRFQKKKSKPDVIWMRFGFFSFFLFSASLSDLVFVYPTIKKSGRIFGSVWVVNSANRAGKRHEFPLNQIRCRHRWQQQHHHHTMRMWMSMIDIATASSEYSYFHMVFTAWFFFIWRRFIQFHLLIFHSGGVCVCVCVRVCVMDSIVCVRFHIAKHWCDFNNSILSAITETWILYFDDTVVLLLLLHLRLGFCFFLWLFVFVNAN